MEIGMAYNEKSRENLLQYRVQKSQSANDKIKKEIAKEVDIDLEQIEIIIPTKKLFNPEEKTRFLSLYKLYLKQFSKDQKLETSDMVAIATLCKNQILEDRIYAEAETIADAMASVEKLKKENAKINDQLAANRSQRVDPRAGQDITMVDVLDNYLKKSREDLERRMQEYQTEEQEFDGKIKSTVEEMIT
jgi:hypothetical protein